MTTEQLVVLIGLTIIIVAGIWAAIAHWNITQDIVYSPDKCLGCVQRHPQLNHCNALGVCCRRASKHIRCDDYKKYS